MKADEIRKMLDDNLVVPLWPQAGQALDLKRGQTYRGAASREYPRLGSKQSLASKHPRHEPQFHKQ
jgi:hypothetical protein